MIRRRSGRWFIFAAGFIPFGIIAFTFIHQEQQSYEEAFRLIEAGEAERVELEITRLWTNQRNQRTRHYIHLSDGDAFNRRRLVSQDVWEGFSQGDIVESYRVNESVYIPMLDAGRDDYWAKWLFLGLAWMPAVIYLTVHAARKALQPPPPPGVLT